MQHVHSGLVSPDWLAERLASPEIRIFDCTIYKVEGATGAGSLLSGRQHWAEEHIPGAVHLDLLEDLSAPRENLPYNLPPHARIGNLLRAVGINPGTILVLYGDGYFSAVTRAWWVLRASGAADVRILDGGLQRWKREGRPVTSEISSNAAGTYSAPPDRKVFASADDVLRALADPQTKLINALSAEQHAGRCGATFGRPGHIPGSKNIPTAGLLDAGANALKPLPALDKIFQHAGLEKDDRIIAYCGGGISATTLLFALHLTGHTDIALYDGSLMEWANDLDLPMSTE